MNICSTCLREVEGMCVSWTTPVFGCWKMWIADFILLLIILIIDLIVIRKIMMKKKNVKTKKIPIGWGESTIEELKKSIIKIIKRSKSKIELEIIFENLYLNFKRRRIIANKKEKEVGR